MYAIYTVRPSDKLVKVMHPHKRFYVAVPESIQNQFWKSGTGFVMNAPWDDLIRWDEVAQRPDWDVRAGDVPSLMKGNAQRAVVVARKAALLAYWEDVRALPGGNDPLWRYGTDGLSKEDPPELWSDERFAAWDTRGGVRVFQYFHRMRLKMKYGTTSLRQYAANNGLVRP